MCNGTSKWPTGILAAFFLYVTYIQTKVGVTYHVLTVSCSWQCKLHSTGNYDESCVYDLHYNNVGTSSSLQLSLALPQLFWYWLQQKEVAAYLAENKTFADDGLLVPAYLFEDVLV